MEMETDQLPDVMVGDDLKPIKVEKIEIEDEVFSDLPMTYFQYTVKKEHVEEDIKIENEVLEISELKKEDTDDEKRVVKTSDEERIVQYVEQNWKLESNFDDCCSLIICLKLNSDGSHDATRAVCNKNGELMSISSKMYLHICDDYCIKSKPTCLDKLMMNTEAQSKKGTEECFKIHAKECSHKCSVCGKRFHYPGILKDHMNTHTGDRPYKCNKCYKTYFSSKSLRLHMKICAGEYSYKCTECGKGFFTPGILKDHMNTHTAERPYKCNECHKGFFSKAGIRRHVMGHTGERRYKCNECHRMFATSDRVNKHARKVHAKDRPYNCDECHKGFFSKDRMKCHIIVHTGARPYKCNECHKMFATSGQLHKGNSTPIRHTNLLHILRFFSNFGHL